MRAVEVSGETVHRLKGLSMITGSILTTLITIAAVNAANAADFGAYGSAPPSLDYPSKPVSMSASDLRREATLDVKKNDWLREELSLLSAVDPFPSGNVSPIDPITKKRMDHALVGPAFKSRAYGADYDYYRYVTFYNVVLRKERIYALPIQRAQCYDRSSLFSSYTYSTSYSANLTASASVEGLGLSASLTETRTFTTNRTITASGDMVADYTPYAMKQDWEGQTYIQLLDSKTGKTSYLDSPKKASAWWVQVLFPFLAISEYPMEFQVKDADWTFVVERQIIESCESNFGAR